MMAKMTPTANVNGNAGLLPIRGRWNSKAYPALPETWRSYVTPWIVSLDSDRRSGPRENAAPVQGRKAVMRLGNSCLSSAGFYTDYSSELCLDACSFSLGRPQLAATPFACFQRWNPALPPRGSGQAADRQAPVGSALSFPSGPVPLPS